MYIKKKQKNLLLIKSNFAVNQSAI